MPVESLIATYGYFALLGGAMFEGETFVILGGFLAHMGYLHYTFVVACAFIGALTVDQFFFHLGRRGHETFLIKRPKLKKRADKIHGLYKNNQNEVVLGLHFLYGIRTITSLITGISGYNPLKFLALNTAGTFVWAFVWGTAGYLFGRILELFFQDLKKYEIWIVLGMLLIGVSVWLIYRKKANKNNNGKN